MAFCGLLIRFAYIPALYPLSDFYKATVTTCFLSSQFPVGSLPAQADKIGIDAFFLQQLLMGAPLYNLATAQRQNLLSVAHRLQTMGNHNYRFIMG